MDIMFILESPNFFVPVLNGFLGFWGLEMAIRCGLAIKKTRTLIRDNQ
jgi:hypothetical protein